MSRSKLDPHSNDPPIEQRPAPVYGNEYGQVDFNQEGFDTSAQVARGEDYATCSAHELTLLRRWASEYKDKPEVEASVRLARTCLTKPAQPCPS